MRRRSQAPDPAEAELFRQHVADVRPLKQKQVVLPTRRPAPLPRQSWLDERAVLAEALSDHVDFTEVETGEELVFRRPGVQHRQIAKLRRGAFSVQAELDLHGYTVDQARTSLVEFLHECQRRGCRCVRIVHGKGNGSPQRLPVLKVKVSHWLQQWDSVLAFCTAHPRNGGTGAVYVLLKAS